MSHTEPHDYGDGPQFKGIYHSRKLFKRNQRKQLNKTNKGAK